MGWHWRPGMTDEAGRMVAYVQFGLPWSWVDGATTVHLPGPCTKLTEWTGKCRAEWSDATPADTHANAGHLLDRLSELTGDPCPTVDVPDSGEGYTAAAMWQDKPKIIMAHRPTKIAAVQVAIDEAARMRREADDE